MLITHRRWRMVECDNRETATRSPMVSGFLRTTHRPKRLEVRYTRIVFSLAYSRTTILPRVGSLAPRGSDGKRFQLFPAAWRERGDR